MTNPADRPTPQDYINGGGTPAGIVCPNCKWTSLPVLYTRRMENGEMARVRQCRRCKQKILCRERVIGQIAEPIPVEKEPPPHTPCTDSGETSLSIYPTKKKRVS